MKKFVKDLSIAKQKGKVHVVKTLKRFLKEDFSEPRLYLYSTEFDYSTDMTPDKGPLLYIATDEDEKFPTAWKKYAQQNKTKEHFSAGKCICEDGVLKFLPNLGKGGKNAKLKIINKQLLKPFAEAVLVNSLESGAVAVTEDDNLDDVVEDTTLIELDYDDAISETEDYLGDIRTIRDIYKGIEEVYKEHIEASESEQTLLVDSSVLSLLIDCVDEITTTDTSVVDSALYWVGEVRSICRDAPDKKNPKLAMLKQDGKTLELLLKEIELLEPIVKKVLLAGKKAQLVKDPKQSKIKLPSRNPLETLATNLSKLKNQYEIVTGTIDGFFKDLEKDISDDEEQEYKKFYEEKDGKKLLGKVEIDFDDTASTVSSSSSTSSSSESSVDDPSIQ